MPTQPGTPVGYRADRTTQQLTPLDRAVRQSRCRLLRRRPFVCGVADMLSLMMQQLGVAPAGPAA
jgi:hypothetical protein